MNISNIVVQKIKATLNVKPELFPGEKVLTLRKVELVDDKPSKSRSIMLSPDAIEALTNKGELENVIGTDYKIEEEVKYVLAGTNESKIKLDGKRVINAYKVNKGTRTVLSKKLWDTISEKFAVDATNEDVNFLLTEVDGVFTLSPYLKPEFNTPEIELRVITHEGQ
jgi:hypothetical protein